MERCVHRFEAATLGAHGDCLLSAVAFALRRRGAPAAARCPLDRAILGLGSAALSLRTAVALRVEHFASLFPGCSSDLWGAAVAQLGTPALEAGSVPIALPGYLAALHREGRFLDTLQLAALADVLSAHLHLFVPASPVGPGGGWHLCWTVAPRGLDLAPLACFRPPLCVGLASGRAWALEPAVEPSDAWGPGLPDVPLAILRAQGALPSISSPSPSSLSLLVDDLERFASSSSDGEGLPHSGGGSGVGLLDAPGARLTWRTPSPPSSPPASVGSDMDLERAEQEEALLAVEAAEVRRHLVLRSRFGALLRAASAAFSVLGRLP